MILRKLLAALVVLIAASASGLSPVAVAEPEFSLDARVALEAFRAAVDGRLQGVLVATRLLAATDEARSGDWARIRDPLGVLATNLPEQAAVWYATADGSLFTVAKGATGETLRERAYFPSLLAGAVVSD